MLSGGKQGRWLGRASHGVSSVCPAQPGAALPYCYMTAGLQRRCNVSVCHCVCSDHVRHPVRIPDFQSCYSRRFLHTSDQRSSIGPVLTLW